MEVSDLEERKALKEVLFDVLVPFYENVNKSYQNLEKRVFGEDARGSYTIITGIARRSRLDLTNTSLFPMCASDAKEQEISIAELVESMENHTPFFLYHLLINADYPRIKKIRKENKTYGGWMITERGRYPICVSLRPTMRYLHQIENLYREFINNNIRWNTVFAPYLYKMFDVYVESVQYPQGEYIEKIELDFEELNDLVEYDCIPIWNICEKECRTSAYPDFCKDRIHYLHTIYGPVIEEKKDYLVSGERMLMNLSKIGDELQIQCSEAEPINWKLKEFSYDIEEMDEKYKLFYSIENKNIAPIHTKAQLKYLVQSFGFGQRLSLEDVRIAEQVNEVHTYDMDAFLTDEIRSEEQKQYLVFEFRKNTEADLFVYDEMSYVVSNLSLIYPEYACVGVLKE
jgi:hypothetical protein